jgi:hypothetical protein
MRDRDVKPGMQVMAFGLESGLPIFCTVLQRDLYDHKRPQEWLLKREADGIAICRAAREFKKVSR